MDLRSSAPGGRTPNRKTGSLAIALASAATLTTCAGPMCGCPPARTPIIVLVTGSVTTDQGTPLPGAAVTASMTPASSCLVGGTSVLSYTDQNGGFRTLLEEIRDPEVMCVHVRSVISGRRGPRDTLVGPFRTLGRSVGRILIKDSTIANIVLTP